MVTQKGNGLGSPLFRFDVGSLVEASSTMVKKLLEAALQPRE